MTPSQPQRPSGRSVFRGPVIRTGLCTAVLLTVVMVTALVVANHVSGLERFALARNAVSGVIFLAILLIPIGRFLRSAKRLFAAAMIGWTLFSFAYELAGIFFQNLFNRLNRTPFEVFATGAIAYGAVAVASWVVSTLVAARRPTSHASPHR